MAISLRRFVPGDLQAVKTLIDLTIDRCYTGVYPGEAIRFFLDYHRLENIARDAETSYTLVLEEDGEIIGTGTLVAADIRRVFIHPDRQGGGRGRATMRALEEEAAAKGLREVGLSASLVAKRFYDALGYVTASEEFMPLPGGEVLHYYEMRKETMV